MGQSAEKGSFQLQSVPKLSIIQFSFSEYADLHLRSDQVLLHPVAGLTEVPGRVKLWLNIKLKSGKLLWLQCWSESSKEL